MKEEILGIIEVLKSSTIILVILSGCTGFVLFSPRKVLEKVNMIEFNEKYGFVIGLVFIISLIALFVRFLFCIGNSLTLKVYSERWKKKRIAFLKKMTENQKFIVYRLFHEDNRTGDFSLKDGDISKLLQYEVIMRVMRNNFTNENFNISFTLQQWVINEVEKDINLIQKGKKRYGE